MNNSFDVVCCSLEDWDDVWRRNQFFVRELLEIEPRARLLFVEPPHDVVHELRSRRWSRPRAVLRSVEGMPRVWAIKPIKVLPRVLGGSADRHLASQVERATRRLGFDRPLLWVNDAAYATLAGRVAWPCLYDITDDWLVAAASPRELRRREQREDFLLARAQEVVVCSPGLAASRGLVRPVRTITNAVDAARYREPAPRPADLPAEPVAVYVGTLHRDRLDVDLVLRAADAAPTVQFAFVGPVALDDRDTDAMRRKPNIHVLGSKPSGMVPAYLQHASVLVVPHVVSAFTESLDPIKAYEYLASGRPVVSTRVAGFRELDEDHVRCVDDAHFAGEVVDAVERGGHYPVSNLASWRSRAESFREALLNSRRSPANRRLTVVYLDHSAQLSGAELALARLLPSLTNVSAVVLLAEPGPLQDRLAEDGITTEIVALSPRTQSLRRDRVRLTAIPLAAAWDSIRYVVTLLKRLRELKPDLVHTNSLKAAVYGSVAARLAGVPVVCHVHDRIASDYLPAPAVAVLRILLRLLPSAVIANSDATLATLDRPGRLPSTSSRTVIHNVVRLPSATDKSTRVGPFCVGMVGRLAPWKGQHVFIEAFAAAFEHAEARALIVGAALFGEDDYATQLQLLAQDLGVSDRVEFVGFVDDVYAQLSLMDVLVHASVTAEPFGQVVVEAMAAGVPVIASAAGGPLEVIEPDTTGLLVPPGDVAALATALKRLHSDAFLRDQLAAAAVVTVARFEPAVIAGQVQEVYDRVMSEFSRRRTW